jgi:hypothetical protein
MHRRNLVLIAQLLYSASRAFGDLQTDDFEKIVASQKFSRLAEASYFQTPEVNDFVAFKPIKYKSGLQAITYYDDKEVVISFAGTDFSSPADIQTNLKAAFPLAKPKQFVEALEYTKDVQRAFSNKRLSATGHSLGGQLALYVGGMLNIDAVAFNAPGPNARMRAEIIAAEFLNRRQGDRAISWNLSAKEALICRPKGKTTNDIVSTKLKHYGETIYVPSTITSTVSKSWLGDIRTYHAMSLMVENIDNTIENGRGGYQISIAAWNSMISAEQISSWSLPSIDFQNRTTLGGGAAPIPLPGIPSEHIVVPSTLELDSLYDFFHAKND